MWYEREADLWVEAVLVEDLEAGGGAGLTREVQTSHVPCLKG